MSGDEEHLQMLAVFHYVFAAVGVLFACFPLLYSVFGVAILAGLLDEGSDVPPRVIGWLLVLIPGTMTLLGWAFAVCVFFAGRGLALRRRYTFCLVIAGIMCLFMPLGTVLGVFTIIVLLRPSVKELFGISVEAT